ncbi:MAG: baseplate J/gp47 family protein [Acidobacteriota bacterium]
MELRPPNLDDRDFHHLMEEARRLIAQHCPDWTDLSPGDPGMALVEVFAHLTETMIYRLNRLPAKVYVELLRLIGAKVAPPSSASVTLRFSRAQDSTEAIEIPRGTRVLAERAADDQEAPIFVTSRAVTLEGEQGQVEVVALQGEMVAGELAATGTGLPGQRLRVHQPPITAPAGSDPDLVVAVEAFPHELDERARAVPFGDRVYRIWTEVDNFANLGAERHLYVADRASGLIQFAPAARWQDEEQRLASVPKALAAVPGADREIRIWYRRGGGEGGNVAAGTLTALKDPLPGVEVTNPKPATGGRDVESLENALVRGPQQLHGLERVVKSKDFERVAIRSSGAVARARALTMARLWRHATAGTVQVVLVPDLPAVTKAEARITAEVMAEHETDDARSRILQALNDRRPLGTACVVQWGRYKTVSVLARIVVYREENPIALRQRVVERLYQTIQPLASEHVPTGWGFGETLRASHIYDMILSEAGVKYADSIRLKVNHVPSEVRALVADQFQPKTWYVSGGESLLRSINDGAGWELVAQFGDEKIRDVCSHPEFEGRVAVSTRPPDGGRAALYMSKDCGESWRPAAEIGFEVEGMAWLPGRTTPTLMLASDDGLFQLSLERHGPELAEVAVQADGDSEGFYSVATLVDVHGNVLVAVASQRKGGVYLSRQGGRPQSFQFLGLRGEDIRYLAMQEEGPNAWLWAAVAAAGNQQGQGCYRWYLSELNPEGWRAFDKGWTAGSCHSLAFQGARVLAGSHRAGVMRLDSSAEKPAWQPSSAATSGLPPRDRGRLVPVFSVACDPAGDWVFAGGPEGVFRSADAERYEPLSKQEFDKVTLPETWLFCSGQHEIEVVTEDEAQ